jgi:PBSX family phage terminase large subunit
MKISATPVFEKNWNALNSNKYKYIINSGSSRSSKTFSILQIFWLLCWSKPRVKCSAFRVTKKDCKDTILQDMLKYYPTLENYNLVVFNKTESVFTFPNGSQIFIEGTDDDLKIMGYHSDYLWFNEFYRISKDTFDQLDMRCSGAVFMDYNPIGTHWADDIMKRENAIVIHSTFRDNPFCPAEQKKKILSYEPTEYNIQQGTADNYKWQVFGLGLKAEKPNRIYSKFIKIPDAEFNALPYPSYYGLDFGSTNPSACVEVKFDGNDSFFVKEILYKPISQMDISLAETLEGLGVRKDLPLICDSADPVRISELRQYGFNAIPAIKGSGSVNTGIDFINSKTIYYTQSSENFDFEYENYEWEVYNGINLDRPIKSNDHILDAFRYCITFLQFYLHIK